MSEALRRESPLVAWIDMGLPVRMSAEGVRLQERAFLGHIGLRCDPGDAALTGAIERTLECSLPRRPNTFQLAPAGRRVLWLGPDEWLIVTHEGGEEMLAAALRRAVGDGFAAVVELGSGQTVIEIAGPRAREVIAKGCPLDLHPRGFGPGSCAQSRLARAFVTIAQVDGTPTFELIVRRSFADYLWRWLNDASRHPVAPRFV
jgi:heterotetrameric sarcosine oxidase gamma subunit